MYNDNKAVQDCSSIINAYKENVIRISAEGYNI